jgi:hypothetical protein
VALPIDPGASFGSALLSGAFASSPQMAFRLDVGVERIGTNGYCCGRDYHTVRWLLGLGPYFRVPLAAKIDFVWGHGGAVRLSRFFNVETRFRGGPGSVGFYYGGSYFPLGAGSDALVVSSGDNNSGTVIDLNLPLGLMLRPDPHLSLTLQAGYSAVIGIPSGGGNAVAEHYLPVGLEAVVSPITRLDIGLNLVFDATSPNPARGTTRAGLVTSTCVRSCSGCECAPTRKVRRHPALRRFPCLAA